MERLVEPIKLTECYIIGSALHFMQCVNGVKPQCACLNTVHMNMYGRVCKYPLSPS